MALQESGEMYLETILILTQSRELVRAIDVGDTMGFSKPSVSRAVGLLKQDGYLTVAPNGAIELTKEGRAVAEKIYERHTTLTSFLVALGVEESVAAQDACKMEHDISDETFSAIKRQITK